MQLGYDLFVNEFNNSMIELEDAFASGDNFKTICMLRFLTSSYYLINYKMYDDRLEYITQQVSYKLLGETYVEKSTEIVLFYDGFGMLNRGLAEIYIDAILRTGKKIVWTLYDFSPDVDEIKKKFSNESKIEIVVIPKLTIIDRMKKLQEVIMKFLPKDIFVYTLPDDVAGIGTISTLLGDVTRYLIDLTDHAFWLGKCAFDYVISSRNIGCSIEHSHRKINKDSILLLPMYPKSREAYPYQGMPFSKDCEFVFSGGSVYKIEGDDKYEKIVEYILNKYDYLKFVYAGNCKNKKIERLEQLFPNQFYYISERSDLDQIMRHAKFYLSTYPVQGGLMTQYAVKNGCIPVSLEIEGDYIGSSKSLLLNPDKLECIKNNENDVYCLIDRLMTDSKFYNEEKNKLINQIISIESFERNIQLILDEKRTEYRPKYFSFNMDLFLEAYKQRMDYDFFKKMIINSRNQWVQRRYMNFLSDELPV